MRGTGYNNINRTAQVMLVNINYENITPIYAKDLLKLADHVPKYTHSINDYLLADVNVASVLALLYWLYYITLDPVAAVSILLGASQLMCSSSTFLKSPSQL